jgi:hypothetical protein
MPFSQTNGNQKRAGCGVFIPEHGCPKIDTVVWEPGVVIHRMSLLNGLAARVHRAVGMTRRSMLAISLMSVPIFAAPATVDGRWIGTVTLRRGDTAGLEFNFKTAGDKLTGTITVLLDNPEPFPITDGRVKGASISFTAERPRGKFSGTMNGDQIDMVVIRGDEDTMRFTAKRAK